MKTKKTNFKTFLRRTKWLFGRSGVMSLGFEHFLAMVPATILVPILVNNTVGQAVIDMSLVLFTSGLGTILFTIVSKGKIPAYLGSSFAYIGLTIYLIDSQVSTGIDPYMAYSYVGWAYIFSGVVLVLLSFLYKKKNIERFLSFILPASVVGPAISLIGLELADTAIVDSGFDVTSGVIDSKAALVSIMTLFVIVLFSLIKRKIFKNAAIIVGTLVGYLLYFFINDFPEWNLTVDQVFSITVPDFHIPILSFPKNWLNLFLSVLPSTFIIFTENLGRVTVINRMVNDKGEDTGIYNKDSIGQLHSGLLCHGISTMAVTLIGSVPNTVYAENIAVMGIHTTESKDDPDEFIKKLTQPFSVYPYFVAAFLAILFSFAGILQSLLLEIPKPVIGGMELFLFGIISAPGIQLLVDQRVNYKKISNQIITAAVLIAGVSGLSVDFGVVELKGMGLGFVVGIFLNLLVQLLKWIGNTSDVVSFDELLEKCIDAALDKSNIDADEKTVRFSISGSKSLPIDMSDLYLAFNGQKNSLFVGSEEQSTERVLDIATHADNADFILQDVLLFSVKKTVNSLIVVIPEDRIDPFSKQMCLNDYPEAIDISEGILHIDIAKDIPMRKVCELVEIATQSSLCEEKAEELAASR